MPDTAIYTFHTPGFSFRNAVVTMLDYLGIHGEVIATHLVNIE